MIAAGPVIHVNLDTKGVAWIDDTNVKVVEVVAEHLATGSSPEEIHFQHPHLSLAQIHSALAYYFDHRAELDADIERRSREIEALRTEAKDQPSRKELLTRLHSR